MSSATPTLRETQKRMAELLMKPWPAGGPKREAARLIRPNDRLTSLERLAIYSCSYWARVLDSLRDDFPGLMTILGSEAFDRMATAYLVECPSQSFTLRDLGSRLPEWLAKHPRYAGQQKRLALDMARLEWAHIEAFDGLAEKTLDPEDLLRLTTSLRAGVQPYVSLLDLHYPVDELRVKLKAAPEDAGAASNAVLEKRARKVARFLGLKPQSMFVAVHRVDMIVYYRRLAREEYRILQGLRSGKPIAKAIGDAFFESSVGADQIPDLLRTWFAAWATFGWLTDKRKKAKRSKSK